MSKILLYCTKAKSYLYRQDDDCFELLNKLKNEDTSVYKKYYRLNNGKIVAECDFEVEEIRYVEYVDEWGYETNTLSEDDLIDKSCLSGKQLFDYLKHCKNGAYAIHIKNLHIFDKPRELSNYCIKQCQFSKCSTCKYGKNNISCATIDTPITKAPQNMMKVESKICDEKDYILISIRPNWLCKILNGEKTIEVRKKVLKEMLSNDTIKGIEVKEDE